MIMFGGMKGEEFIDYLLSTSEDQQTYCQKLVPWKNKPKKKLQHRDDDILDESEGSVSFSYLILFSTHYNHVLPFNRSISGFLELIIKILFV